MLSRAALLVAILAASSLPLSAAPGIEHSWPHHGSFAVYSVNFGEAVPGFSTETSALLLFRHDGDTWQVRCIAKQVDRLAGEPPKSTAWRSTASIAPPTGPTVVSVGERVEVGALRGCSSTSFEVDITEFRDGGRRWGDVILGEDVPECRCQETKAAWNGESGLTLAWRFAGSTSHQEGRLIATNAPLR